MRIVLITALGVGMATVFGSVVGFLLKRIPNKFNDIILSLAAGVMFAAAVYGLILPAVEDCGGIKGTVFVSTGVISGALFLNLMDKTVPYLYKIAGINKKSNTQNNDDLNRVLLFVMAIAIHNFPEGIATGVSFGTGNISDAITVATGIALQNIPEGMVIITPMLNAGIKKSRTMLIAFSTGFVEIIGTVTGYFVVSVCSLILPFALGFAGGTMLYVICDEMIPDAHSNSLSKSSTYSLLAGFCAMVILDAVI